MIKKSFLFSIILSIVFILSAPFVNNYALLLSLSFGIIIIFNIKALFEKNFKKYFALGFMVQAGYVLLDASISGLSGKSPFVGFLQLINFSIPGVLLIMSAKGNDFNSMKLNNYSLLGIFVACLALAGLPGFNLFVGEYFLYIMAYDIHPALLMLCFICSILTLITYLRLISHASASIYHKKPSALFKFSSSFLSILCIILGIAPWIQMALFEVLL
jgi:formate hydrogenlyase subunit 3/multisubunit Na+/H+ antiporter MnhD subunit